MKKEVIICYDDENEYYSFKTEEELNEFYQAQMNEMLGRNKEKIIGGGILCEENGVWYITQVFSAYNTEALVNSTIDDYVEAINRGE